MENKTKERVGPLTRIQCKLMKDFLIESVVPSFEELKDAGFPFFETVLSDKTSYSRQRFKVWASKLQVRDGTLVFGATGKEIICKEDLEHVVMETHYNNSEKHMKGSSVLSKLKERYSIKRRAFGPSEDAIRDIVYSCQNDQCRFAQVANYKHTYEQHTKATQVTTEAHHGSNLSNLSPGKIQNQLKIAGIGTVSPTSGKYFPIVNRNHNNAAQYSPELYHFIGDQIDKSAQMKQRQGSSRNSDSNSRIKTLEPLRNLSPDKSDFEQGDRNRRECGLPKERKSASVVQTQAPSYPVTTKRGHEAPHCLSDSGRRNTVSVSPIASHGIPGHNFENSLSFCGKTEQTNVTMLLGKPTMSSRVFGDKRNSPFDSPASCGNRLILPSELPHIYPKNNDKLNFANERKGFVTSVATTSPVSSSPSYQPIHGKQKWGERNMGILQTDEQYQNVETHTAKRRRLNDLHEKRSPSISKTKSRASCGKIGSKGYPSENPTTISINCGPDNDNFSAGTKKSNKEYLPNLTENKHEKKASFDPMKLMWDELRKNKGKEELQVIARSEKNPENHIKDTISGKLGKNSWESAIYSKLVPTNDDHAKNQDSPTNRDCGTSSVRQTSTPAANQEVLYGRSPRQYIERNTSVDRNDNIWKLHQNQKYLNHLTSNFWENKSEMFMVSKPPPAHITPASPGFLNVSWNVSPKSTAIKLTDKDVAPIDLSVNKTERILVSKPKNEALDLSMKRDMHQANSSGIETMPIPVASIKSTPAQKQNNQDGGQEVRSTVVYSTDKLHVPSNLDFTKNRNEVMETSNGTLDDDGIEEVASVRVSLYVKAPQKFAKAVISTIPGGSPGVQVSSHVIQNDQRSPLVLKNSLTSLPGLNSQSVLEKPKENESRDLRIEQNEQIRNRNPSTPTKSTFDSQTRHSFNQHLLKQPDAIQCVKKSANSENARIEKELTPDSVKVNLFGTQAVTILKTNNASPEAYKRPAATTSDQRKINFSPNSKEPQSFLQSSVDSEKKAPVGRKKRKQKEKKARRKRVRRIHDDVRINAATLDFESTVTNGFNTHEFLSQKRIEAYEIKMKEAERLKEEILETIIEEAASMKGRYRKCLVDLGKNNLEKIRNAIQRLMVMIRECRTALTREENAAICIEALKDT